VVILCATREVEVQARDLVKKDQDVLTLESREVGVVQRLFAMLATSSNPRPRKPKTKTISILLLMRIEKAAQ
jgi:hypothetical protein